MRFVEPKKTVLSVIDNNITYTKDIAIPFTTISGVVDENYAEYNAGVTYNAGDYVKIDALKTIYRCSADGTIGIYPPSDETKWTDWGFLNSYRMLTLDDYIGATTTGTDVVIDMNFDAMDTIALIDADFTSLKIEQFNDSDGSLVATYNISGNDISTTDFAGYFYDNSTKVTRVIKTEMEWLPNSSLKLTFAGDMALDRLYVGMSSTLGCTLYGTSLKFEDRSKIKINPIDNTREVLRYGHIRILNAKLTFQAVDFSLYAQKISRIIGKFVVFIPTTQDRYLEMTNVAYIENFDIPVDNPVVIQTTATLIGVSK